MRSDDTQNISEKLAKKNIVAAGKRTRSPLLSSPYPCQ